MRLYIDKHREFAIKAYEEDDKCVLEMVTLIPKYRGGYHVNKWEVKFDVSKKANSYFKKVRASKNELHEVSCCIMANGMVLA